MLFVSLLQLSLKKVNMVEHMWIRHRKQCVPFLPGIAGGAFL